MMVGSVLSNWKRKQLVWKPGTRVLSCEEYKSHDYHVTIIIEHVERKEVH